MIDVVEFNHDPVKFYCPEMDEVSDKMATPQIILGSAHPLDLVGPSVCKDEYVCHECHWTLQMIHKHWFR